MVSLLGVTLTRLVVRPPGTISVRLWAVGPTLTKVRVWLALVTRRDGRLLVMTV